jgi:hypothetical protein
MKLSELIKISDPAEVKRRFEKYRGATKATIEPSPRADKKYLIRVSASAADGQRGRAVHIGSTMEDFTKHADEARRKSYLARASAIRGDWKSDKWSANNLAIHLLW